MHHCLTACDKCQLPAAARVIAAYRSEEAPRVSRLAGEIVSQHDGLISVTSASLRRRFAQLRYSACHHRRDIVQLLDRLRLEHLHHSVGELQVILLNYVQCILGRGAVGICRSRCYHIRMVAYDIRKDDGIYMCRSAYLRESAALDLRYPLADGIHLDYVRAACQQRLVDLGELLQRDSRALKECRAAAREQEQHAILIAQMLHRPDHRACSLYRVLIEHGMSRLVYGKPVYITLGMFILRDDISLVISALEAVCRRLCHLPARLADRYDDSPALARADISQCSLNCRVRKRLLYRLARDLHKLLFHVLPPPCTHDDTRVERL